MAADGGRLSILLRLPDFGILLALRSFAFGPVGTDGDGLPTGDSGPLWSVTE